MVIHLKDRCSVLRGSGMRAVIYAVLSPVTMEVNPLPVQRVWNRHGHWEIL